MNKGVIISGIGHIGLILWVLIGGFFTRHEAPEIAVTEVSLISSAEFEAIQAASPTAPAPEPAQTEIAAPAPVQPEPEAPPPEPVVETPPSPVTPPSPTPEPAPETAPDVAEIAPLPVPEAPSEPAPPAPVVTDFPPVLAPASSARPKPRPAPSVAPTPSEAPAPDAQPDVAPTPAVTPEEAPDAQVVEEEKPETAPPETGDVLETEANKDDKLAPSSSARPRKRPARTEVAAKPEAPAEPATEPAGSDAINDALAEAMAEETSEPATETAAAPAAASGPPMTAGEKDGLRVAVQQCWNVGSLSSEALNVTVTVAVSVAQSGVPDAGSIQMIGFEGGSDGAARQAFEAARRAIIRCGATGFKLPAEKYEQWRNIEMVFNPEKMRIK